MVIDQGDELQSSIMVSSTELIRVGGQYCCLVAIVLHEGL